MKPLIGADMAYIGRLRDYAARADQKTDPFLHFMPQLFEMRKIPTALLPTVVRFTEEYYKGAPTPLILDALKILNQLVSRDDGTLVTPNPTVFSDVRYFKWAELGNHTDAVSVVIHVINKLVLRLNLERS